MGLEPTQGTTLRKVASFLYVLGDNRAAKVDLHIEDTSRRGWDGVYAKVDEDDAEDRLGQIQADETVNGYARMTMVIFGKTMLGLLYTVVSLGMRWRGKTTNSRQPDLRRMSALTWWPTASARQSRRPFIGSTNDGTLPKLPERPVRARREG
jgi:hypothetical protein